MKVDGSVADLLSKVAEQCADQNSSSGLAFLCPYLSLMNAKKFSSAAQSPEILRGLSKLASTLGSCVIDEVQATNKAQDLQEHHPIRTLFNQCIKDRYYVRKSSTPSKLVTCHTLKNSILRKYVQNNVPKSVQDARSWWHGQIYGDHKSELQSTLLTGEHVKMNSSRGKSDEEYVTACIVIRVEDLLKFAGEYTRWEIILGFFLELKNVFAHRSENACFFPCRYDLVIDCENVLFGSELTRGSWAFKYCLEILGKISDGLIPHICDRVILTNSEHCYHHLWNVLFPVLECTPSNIREHSPWNLTTSRLIFTQDLRLVNSAQREGILEKVAKAESQQEFTLHKKSADWLREMKRFDDFQTLSLSAAKKYKPFSKKIRLTDEMWRRAEETYAWGVDRQTMKELYC